MYQITRSVRFCVNAMMGSDGGYSPVARAKHNSFAGFPSMNGLGAFYELEVSVVGSLNGDTGYLKNISEIDRAVREAALPIIDRAIRQRPQPAAAQVLMSVLPALQRALDATVATVAWRLTPYHAVAMHSNRPAHVVLSQQFEFAASHRLHVATFTDEKNRAIFGKCNNPNGHGHNYRIEPAVAVPIEPASGSGFTLQELERIVDEVVIRRFDHKHLNLDTTEFANLNPSVENITKVCYELLRGPIHAAGGVLERVTVWETEKTRCSFPA